MSGSTAKKLLLLKESSHQYLRFVSVQALRNLVKSLAKQDKDKHGIQDKEQHYLQQH